jgi:hypothetical protein
MIRVFLEPIKGPAVPGFASRFARKADHNRAEAALIGLYACWLAGHG